MIEKVLLNTTLKAGKDVWEKGIILNAPLPQAILDEIAYNTGTVKVIKGDTTPSTKLVFVAERVAETATSMTTMTTKEPPRPKIIQNNLKPKPNKLIRRS
jgi:hypothetical protein